MARSGLSALAILFVLLMFVIAPLRAVRAAPFVLEPVVVPVLVAAVIAVADSVLGVAAVLLTILLSLLALGLGLWGPSPLILYIDMAAMLLLGSALLWVVGSAVFAAGRVTYHRVVGALLLYLTIGGTFAGLYGLIVLILPRALTQMPPVQHGPAMVAHMLYSVLAR